MGRGVVIAGTLAVSALALGGCTKLFGLDPPVLYDAATGDGGRDGMLPHDAIDAPGSNACPSNYMDAPFGGTYRFVTSAQTWDFAQADCVDDTIAGGSKHTHLIVVTSDSELNSASAFDAQNEFWTGLTDRVTEGAYLWVTAESTTYPPAIGAQWAPGEPTGSVAEDCIAVDQFQQMSDTSCADQKKYLCECDAYAADPARY